VRNVCDERHEHKERVSKIKAELETKEIVEKMVKLLRACADETRLKILIALSKANLCTCDLSEILSLSSSAISSPAQSVETFEPRRLRQDWQAGCLQAQGQTRA